MTIGRWIFAGILLLLVGFGTFRGLQPHPPPPVEVTTAVARKGEVTRTVAAAGHLQARETVKVSSNVTGELLSRFAIKDLTVEEPPIEEVIEQAFAGRQPS